MIDSPPGAHGDLSPFMYSPAVSSDFNYSAGHDNFPHTSHRNETYEEYEEPEDTQIYQNYISRPTMRPAQPPPKHPPTEGYLAVSAETLLKPV